MGQTARLKLDYPELTDGPDGADVPYWVKKLAEDLDGVAPIDVGNLADRPPASSGSPYIPGAFYVSLDQSPKQVDVCLGSSWLTIFPIASGIADGSITTAKLADHAVTEAKIAAGAVGTAELAIGAVAADKISNLLKPSVGAGAGVEALRAIGSTAGKVVAGNDSRLALISNGYSGVAGSPVLLADSPWITGTPLAPTAAIDTNTDQIATTAFVLGQGAQVSDGVPLPAGSVGLRGNGHFAYVNHVHPHDTTKADLASPTLTGTVTAPIFEANDASPRIGLYETDAGSDEKHWSWFGSSGTLTLATRHDDRSIGTIVLQVSRTGISPDSANFVNLFLRNKGMNVHRHPYGNDRHIESGDAGAFGSGGVSVTFTDPFGSTPRVIPGGPSSAGSNGVASTNSITTTGFTLGYSNDGGSGGASGQWIAEGAD